jgi:hypothetical protein
MNIMKKYYLLVGLLFLFLFSSFLILGTKAVVEKQIATKTKLTPTGSSNYNCDIETSSKTNLQNTYINKKWCFSIDYPNNWSHHEYNEITEAYSLEAVGFNDVATDDSSFDKNKIVINNYNNYPLGLVVGVALLKDTKIDHFRSLEDYRIQGNYKGDNPLGWVYSDTVYLQNYTTGQVMTISYREIEYSEKNRKIFNDMLETLEFSQ